MPRVLANVSGGHTQLTLFGQTYDAPILAAPIAYQRLFHSDGEAGGAAAADAQGCVPVVSSLASQPLDVIARGLERKPWFQLYWQGTRDRTLQLLQRAEAAGYAVVVFTVDAPVKQSSFVLPPHVSAVNLDAPATPQQSGGSEVFDGWMADAPSWDDLVWLRANTRLPLLIKGVMNVSDAVRAADIGCDGVIVSNHGGRTLDGVPASATVLPSIVAALEGRVPVLCDSGVRSGRDVLRALALGATAVLVGRPCIWGLAAAGAMGVAHVLRLLRDELEMSMALTGCRTLADIDSRCLAE